MHRRIARLLAVSFICFVAAVAQPVIRSQNPAVNSASYRTPGMPGSGVAQGSIFVIFGTGLGPNSVVESSTFPLPTMLSDTSVTVTVGGTAVSAIMIYTYVTQVAAILPSTTPVGSGTVTVTYNGQTSVPAPIQVVDSAFGIYTYNQAGAGQAIATDVHYNINSIIHTFHPGDYGILWGTGLGAIKASDAGAPPVGNLPTPIKVYVGDTTSSDIYYQGRSGCCAGLDQIVFQIPPGVTGCYVPIAVEAGGVLGNVGNIATIAVSDSGETCSDSVMGQDLVNQLASGKTVDFGYIRLESTLSQYIPGSAGTASGDVAMATFSEYTPGTAGLAQYGVSSGYCVAVDCSYGCDVDSYNGSISDSSPAQLDAGTLSVLYSPPVTLNQYGGYYGADLTNEGQRYLWSALTYPFAGTGGAAVGAFSVNDVTSIPATNFEGINNAQSLSVSGDLTVKWTGGNPMLQNGQVTIGGYSGNSALTQFELLQCTAPLAAGQLTIPGWVISALPPSGTGGTDPYTYPLGWIWIGQYNNPTPFSATGLTSGIITDIFYNGLGVYFQ